MQLTSQNKIVVSGTHVERYKYTNAFYFGSREANTTTQQREEESAEDRERRLEISRKQNAYRCQANFVRIVKANQNRHPNTKGKYFHTFVTLTYRDNETDVAKAQRDFAKFIQRLNYKQLKAKKTELKYIGVIEFQERGAIHFHVLFFNLERIDNTTRAKHLDKLWGHGDANIKGIQSIERSSKYMAKYLVKSFMDKRLYRKKKFFCASNMYRPHTIINESAIKIIHERVLDHHVHIKSYSYHSAFLGEVFVYLYEIPHKELDVLFFEEPPPINETYDDW